MIFVYFRRKPKILVVQFYQKTDMPACHHRAYLFRNDLKLFCSEQEVWRVRSYAANHPNMPKIAVFGRFRLFLDFSTLRAYKSSYIGLQKVLVGTKYGQGIDSLCLKGHPNILKNDQIMDC